MFICANIVNRCRPSSSANQILNREIRSIVVTVFFMMNMVIKEIKFLVVIAVEKRNILCTCIGNGQMNLEACIAILLPITSTVCTENAAQDVTFK